MDEGSTVLLFLENYIKILASTSTLNDIDGDSIQHLPADVCQNYSKVCHLNFYFTLRSE